MSTAFNVFTGTFDIVSDVTVNAVGSSPNANGITVNVAGPAINLTLQPADATHPGVVTTGTQTIAGNKTFSGNLLGNYFDVPSAGTLAIGTLTATTINIGNVSSTVNIMGTVITENSSTLNVTNPVFTVNTGGAAGSASNSGMQVSENSIITGYVETSADRNSWILLAPNTAGVATITPGAGGITLNQSSHNPVTIGTANGLSLSTQVLSLGLASSGVTGALSGTDWNTFNSKTTSVLPSGDIFVGNGSNVATAVALSGDATLSNAGALTLASVASGATVGSSTSIPTFTFNNKGLVTSASGNAVIAPAGTLSGTTLNTTVVSSSLTSVGTITSGTWNGTTIAIANGGTGQITQQAAINALTGTQSNATFLRSDGTNASLTAIQSTDLPTFITGDLNPTSFSAANNQSSAANVTGLAFVNATTRAFTASVSVTVIATGNLYEYFRLDGVQRGADWQLTQSSVGDSSGFVFTITNTGQIKYTNNNYSGFTSATLKFRAITAST